MGTQHMVELLGERPYSKSRLDKALSLYIRESKHHMSREYLDGTFLRRKMYWQKRADTKLGAEIDWVALQSELVVIASYFQRYLKKNGAKKTQKHYMKIREDFLKESDKMTREHLSWLLNYFNEGTEGALFPDTEVGEFGE